MDRLSPAQRSALMSRVRGRDTKPEHLVRSIVHRLGYRYQLHVADLAGKPDLVFPSRRKIIFVHGCFWHRHGCKRGGLPSTNVSFWKEKLERNRSRDHKAIRSLKKAGWRVMVVWECRIGNSHALRVRLDRFLADAEGN